MHIPCSVGSRLNGSLYVHAMNNKQLHDRRVATKLSARPSLFPEAVKVCFIKAQNSHRATQNLNMLPSGFICSLNIIFCSLTKAFRGLSPTMELCR
jgi:hypothetical protein